MHTLAQIYTCIFSSMFDVDIWNYQTVWLPTFAVCVFTCRFCTFFTPGFASSLLPECVTSDIILLLVAKSIGPIRPPPNFLRYVSIVAVTFITIVTMNYYHYFCCFCHIIACEECFPGPPELLVVAKLYLQVWRPSDERTLASGCSGSVSSLVVEEIRTFQIAAAAQAK